MCYTKVSYQKEKCKMFSFLFQYILRKKNDVNFFSTQVYLEKKKEINDYLKKIIKKALFFRNLKIINFLVYPFN